MASATPPSSLVQTVNSAASRACNRKSYLQMHHSDLEVSQAKCNSPSKSSNQWIVHWLRDVLSAYLLKVIDPNIVRDFTNLQGIATGVQNTPQCNHGDTSISTKWYIMIWHIINLLRYYCNNIILLMFLSANRNEGQAMWSGREQGWNRDGNWIPTVHPRCHSNYINTCNGGTDHGSFI